MDKKEACEVCGYVSSLGAVAQHHIMPKSAAVRLCCNCHFEILSWYRMKVTDMVFDPQTKRFKAKSQDEKMKDHKSAFRDFKKYKDEQRKLAMEAGHGKTRLLL